MPHRQRSRVVSLVLLVLVATTIYSQNSVPQKAASPITKFVRVETNVRLEVLDWGGSGRPLVLLPGGGDTAHVFDGFGPKLAAHYRIYGITRRGFGVSGYSPTNNPADRLGKDVLTVINSLELKRPVLIGHSIAGAELSWIANSHADRVAGLVYLEAGYSYAFDNGQGASIKQMMRLSAPQPPPPEDADLASFAALQKYYVRVNGFGFPESELRQQWQSAPDGRVGKHRSFPGGAMLMTLITNPKKYTNVRVPAMFIFANPHSLGTWVDKNAVPSIRREANAYAAALDALTNRQETAVEHGLPKARVITLPGANHYVYLSNEADVLREVEAFLAVIQP
jgi:pimeloyl-ACP methyl ester carboxylesterase